MTSTQLRRLFRLMVMLAVLAGISAAACNRDAPTGPTTPPPPAGPTTPTAPAVSHIEVVAPPSVTPGQTVQLKVRAFRSDGTVEEVSDGVRWSNPFSNVLQVAASGSATGRSAGETTVFATYSSRTASANILVLPENTYRLVGFVRDYEFGIEGATVEVVSGTGTGLTTRTANDGSYRLYGVAGEVGLHVRKNGYVNTVTRVEVTSHRSYDMTIAADGVRHDHSGSYRLTIRANGACADFPAEARERSYDAEVRQDGGALTVSLSGASFILERGRGNGFRGYLNGSGGFIFRISDVVLDSDWYYYYSYSGAFDVAEHIGPRTLLVHGTATASTAGDGITGRLDAYLRTTGRTQPPFLPFERICYSTGHIFELRRR